MSHTAELIAVGTELLLGNIANTDAQMLPRGLSALGINVYYHTVVGTIPDGSAPPWTWPNPGRPHHHHRRAGTHLRRPDQKCPGRVFWPQAGLQRRGRGALPAPFQKIGREMTANNAQQFLCARGGRGVPERLGYRPPAAP